MNKVIVKPDKYMINRISESLYRDWKKRRPSSVSRLFQSKRSTQSALSNDKTTKFEEKFTSAQVSTVRDRIVIHEVSLRSAEYNTVLNNSFKLEDYDNLECFQNEFYQSWIKGVVAIELKNENISVRIE